jgi:hypothetical protein
LEISIAFFITGLVVFVAAMLRYRAVQEHFGIAGRIAQEYDIDGLDLSGNAEYNRCFSHQWVNQNVQSQKPGRLRRVFERRMADNTLVTLLWLSLILSGAAMVIALLMLGSIAAIGPAGAVFFFGALIIIGPGNAKMSQDFIQDIDEREIEELCAEDYAYVRIAVCETRRWTAASTFLGISFMVFSSFGDYLPEILTTAISLFTVYLLLTPAMTLAEHSVVLGILYIPVLLMLLFVILPGLLFSKFRSECEEEGRTTCARW